MKPMKKTIDVCAAVVRQNGRIWICGRPRNTPLEGYMEFPGGKLEPGESHAECLKRELREELGVEIRVLDCIHVLEHDYGEKDVRVFFYRAFPREDSPEPLPRESQEFRIVRTANLAAEAMLPADLPLAELLAESAAEKNIFSRKT